MSDNYSRRLKAFANDYNNAEAIEQMFTVFHDFNYMARPECVQYLSQKTDWIEKLIEPVK